MNRAASECSVSTCRTRFAPLSGTRSWTTASFSSGTAGTRWSAIVLAITPEPTNDTVRAVGGLSAPAASAAEAAVRAALMPAASRHAIGYPVA